MPKVKSAAQALHDAESAVVSKLRKEQTTQGFDGSLRVRLDRVFVDRQEGLRAIDVLRKLGKRTDLVNE